jgi:hypothetical protein
LAELPVDAVGEICEARLDPDDAALLRAMGLSLSAKVRMCRAGEPCIVAVLSSASPCQGGVVGDGRVVPCCSSRIGLARSLAKRILVTRVTSITSLRVNAQV